MINPIREGVGVVFNDAHVPHHNRPLFAAMLDVIADVDADFVVANGDVFDLAEFSRHEKGSAQFYARHLLSETKRVGNKVFDELDAAMCAGKRRRKIRRLRKRRMFIGGNHEARLAKFIASGDNVVFSGDEDMDLAKWFRFRARGWEWDLDYPDAGVWAGKLLITHGQFVGKACAKKHLDEYQCSVLVGHTHTDQTYHGSTYEAQRVGDCNGAMADFDADVFRYKRRPRNWVNSFRVVTVRLSGDFSIEPVRFVNGLCSYGGKTYGKRAK